MKAIPLLFIPLTITVSVMVAGPFPFNVANDVYSGTVNGIPTARDKNDGLPDQYDAVNLLLGTAYTANKDIDGLLVTPSADDVWTLPGGSGSVALIGLTAGNVNTLGYYTGLGTGSGKNALLTASGFGFVGNGTSASPFPASLFSPSGSFGFYLTSVAGSVVKDYYSEPALNAADGGLEHMMTFALPGLAGQTVYINTGSGAQAYTFNNPYMVAWEDLGLSGITLGDDDFDDMIYLFDAKPTGVPDTANTAWLFAVSAMLVGYARRRWA